MSNDIYSVSQAENFFKTWEQECDRARRSRRGSRLGRKQPERSADQEPFPAARPHGEETRSGEEVPPLAPTRDPTPRERRRYGRPGIATVPSKLLPSSVRDQDTVCPAFFKGPRGAQNYPPEGAQCAATGPTPARADTPDANSLAHGERRRARRPRPTSTSPLAVPQPTKRQAQSSDRGTNPRGPPAQICRLSPVTGHRCVASGLGAVPRRKEQVPPPAQTCLPMSVSARRMRHKYGTGKAGASLHFFDLSPKTVRGPAGTQGCTHPAPQPHSSTRRGRARRPKTDQASGQSLTNS